MTIQIYRFQFYFVWLGCFALSLVICTGVFCKSAMAQEPAKQEVTKKVPATQSTTPAIPSTSSELVEGLLDLLNAPPAAKKSDMPPPTPLTPADVGLDGEDLGEDQENPLQAVRQSMLIAAAYLGREGANAHTMQLQSDIVRRLDDLISEMEKSQSSQNQSKKNTDQQSTLTPKPQQQNQPPQSQSSKPRPGESRDPKESQDQSPLQGEPENPPTQKGSAGGVAVELSDPKALQQDVWGQLPSRVRQQMQSRMVEQFLPAYREQIEAYFQALLK